MKLQTLINLMVMGQYQIFIIKLNINNYLECSKLNNQININFEFLN